jgi:hypothetical protein
VFDLVLLLVYLLEDCTSASSAVAHKASSSCSTSLFFFQCSNAENTMDMKPSCYVGTHVKKIEYNFIYFNVAAQKIQLT